LTFTANNPAGQYSYVFGAAQAVDFNLNGTATVTDPSTDLDSPSSGNVSSFGFFNNTLDNFDGDTHAFTSVVITLVATGLTSWADAGSVLTPNASGNVVAAHILVHGDTNLADEACETGVCATGFAGGNGNDVNPTSTVPEPTSMLLLGTGLLGGARVFRRRKN
jgi:hypothetical protein